MLETVMFENEEWEVTPSGEEERGYEYKEAEIPILTDHSFTYDAIKKLMDSGIKTNIHFIFSSKIFPKIMRLLNGEDIWEGKVDLTKLNAVIFLLFKPQGRGKKMPTEVPTEDQIKKFASLVCQGKIKFKLGMDSCLVNRIKRLNMFPKEQEMFVDTCEAARASTYVSPDMKMLPCSFMELNDNEKMAFDGDIYNCNLVKHSIEEVWKDSLLFQECRGFLEKNPMQCPFGL